MRFAESSCLLVSVVRGYFSIKFCNLDLFSRPRQSQCDLQNWQKLLIISPDDYLRTNQVDYGSG